MNRRAALSLGLALIVGTAALPAAGAPAPPTPSTTGTNPAPPPARPRKSPVYISGVLDSGQFLPDTTVLVRVDDRTTRIVDYVDAYFASYAPVRPRPDSLGRVEFLNSIVDKEVMALTALAISPPLGFEDRALLRDYTERVLSNVLYQRAVLDSVVVTNDQIARAYESYGYLGHFRSILTRDRATAERVRRDLIAGRLPWSEAVRRYSEAKSSLGPDGDIGWVPPSGFAPVTAVELYALEPGQISPVISDDEGIHIWQVLERRKVDPPDFGAVRFRLVSGLRGRESSWRADRLQEQLATQIGMVYDTANIVWASAQFKGHGVVKVGPGGQPVLDLSGDMPEFTPADTARVLARHKDGHFTLGAFLSAYNAISPVMRVGVGSFESFRAQLDGMILEPYTAALARARGLEKDSIAVALIGKKREELLVNHLYADSVQSRVSLTEAERLKYYRDHIASYMTYPSVRFAAIVRHSKAGADSLVAQLRAGVKAADILRADSLRGEVTGSIRTRRQDEQGPYHKILFGELHAGQATVVGPDAAGVFLALQVVEYDPGRQLSYPEVASYVDESLHNIREEQQLREFITRHRKHHRIETHAERVMLIRLVDPLAE